MLEPILALLGGLVLLVIGGELLVRGAVSLAERLGVSPLLIGLTLVGFGTSMPELVVSVEASRAGPPGVAIGNIVGSNISNILLILGISALILPLSVSASALKRDGSIGVLAALAFALAGISVGLTWAVGAVLSAALIAYLVFAYRQERQIDRVLVEGRGAAFDKAVAFEQVDAPRMKPLPGILGWVVPILVALAGLAIIIFGGRILVSGAVEIARILGMSEAVIGLTIVAVGTSLPELVTSVMAALKRQTDIAVGNVLGSNIYNLFGIGGVTGLIAPTAFPAEIAAIDSWVMLGASVALMVFAFSGRISRSEGAVLLASYVGYTVWLLLRNG
ncbi:MAG: calcium/sodium antiporter [Thermaurantiacus sp.]